MEDEQFELPEALAEGLRAAYSHRVEIPAERERAVLGAARVEFGRRRRMRIVTRWGTGVAAAIAAMIVVVVWVHHSPAPTAVAKGDVNADGRVDIVDVLALARHLVNKDQVEKGWDVNGDGVVDQRDVDALGAAAVSLKGGAVARGGLPGLRELGIDRGMHVADGDHAGMPTPAYGAGLDDRRVLAAGEGMAPNGGIGAEEGPR